jgi:hypothetical protein
MQKYNELLLKEKISHIADPVEIRRRREEPQEPEIIHAPLNENKTQANLRMVRQSRQDKEYSRAHEKWENDQRNLEGDFGHGIATLTSLCSIQIKEDIYSMINGAEFHGIKNSEKYQRVLERLRTRWGPHNQGDVEELRNILTNLDGDSLGWQQAMQTFDQTVTSMEMTPMRSADGAIMREKVAANVPPRPAPGGDPQLMQEWREQALQALEEAEDAGGRELNYRPTDAQLKEYLLEALKRSRMPQFYIITNDAVRGRNLHWTYQDIRKDILSQAQKDAQEKALRSGRRRHHSPEMDKMRSSNALQEYGERRERGRRRRAYSSESSRSRDRSPERNRERKKSPEKEANVQKKDEKEKCHNCGQEGHRARDCPSSKCGDCEGTFSDPAARRRHWVKHHQAHVQFRPDPRRDRSPKKEDRKRGRSRSSSRESSPGRTPNHRTAYLAEQSDYEA